MAISLRNAGAGVAVLHGWRFYPERQIGIDEPPPLASFTRLSRDIYIPARDLGFWQGTFRDPASAEFAAAKAAVEGDGAVTVDVLYGDHEGGQRTIARFGLAHHSDGVWLTAVSRYWNVDGAAPR
jgi:hypothetical protein